MELLAEIINNLMVIGAVFVSLFLLGYTAVFFYEGTKDMISNLKIKLKKKEPSDD